MAQPAGFMSYALVDDSDGRLQQFRAELEGEVWAHLGEQIPIRPSPEEITAGKGGEADLGPALSEVTLLIPILSPSFFNSPTCRNALMSFLQRETELQQQPKHQAVRNEERRHHNRGNEVRSTQRCWVDAHSEQALIERDEEVSSAPNVEHQNHRGREPCARGERPYGQNRENGRKEIAICCRSSKS